MMAFLAIPTLLSSIFFMSGGLYTFVLKRSILPLMAFASASALHGVSFYLILANPTAYIGFCIAATASLCALAIGIFRQFCVNNKTKAERAVSITIYSVGLGSTFFYHGVLFTKLALVSSVTV